jgi:hypothetical protein
MSESIRFPLRAAGPAGPNESNLIIQLFSGAGNFPPGGFFPYTSISALKLDTFKSASPFCTVIIEFTTDTAQIVGNGTTEMVGLYGCIGDPTDPLSQRYLLGGLGMGIGAKMPQIYMPVAADAHIVGFAQVVSLSTLYDGLSIGSVGLAGAVAFAGNVTVTARPVRRRDFAG